MNRDIIHNTFYSIIVIGDTEKLAINWSIYISLLIGIKQIFISVA